MAKKQKKGEKKAKRPHPQAAKLDAGPPAAEHVARREGTAGLLGRLPASSESMSGSPRGGVHVHGGVIRGPVHAGPGAEICLDDDVLIGKGAPLTVGVGAVINMKRARSGDRYVDDLEVSAHHASGITAAQISSPAGAVVSALGEAPTNNDVHQRAGDAMVGHFGHAHRAVVEEGDDGRGAEMRDGTFDKQVDVFLRAISDKPADDRKLQVARMATPARELGLHEAAIDLVVDAQAIAAAIALKDLFAGKETIDLVVHCPVVVGAPTRAGLTKMAAARGFDTHGYRCAWLVDASGWVTRLAGG